MCDSEDSAKQGEVAHIFEGKLFASFKASQSSMEALSKGSPMQKLSVCHINCCIFPCLLKQKSTFLLAGHVKQSGLQADPQVLEANMKSTMNFEWKSLSNNSWPRLEHFSRAVRCYHTFHFHGAYFLIDVVKQMNSTDKVEVKLRRECQDEICWHKQQIV